MTPDRRAALLALKDAVEAGEFPGGKNGPVRRLWPYHRHEDQDLGLIAHCAFDNDMNAALALLGAVLPRVHWAIFSQTTPEFVASIIVSHPDGPDEYDGVAPTPARALLLAIIKALIAQEARDG